jgi:primary-amine oxidase
MSETVAVSAPVSVDHPLAMLTAEEVRAAVEILRSDDRIGPDARFVHVVLHEPAKADLLAWSPGDPVVREVRALAVTGPGLRLVEAIVSVTRGELVHLDVVEGMRPALLFGESIDAVAKVKSHPEWQAAMRKRGITDLDAVQIDPWPAGNFGIDHETDRRISRCLSYVREHAQDNGYARPVEGVIAFFDSTNGEVLEVVDYGEVPLPLQGGGYLAADVGPVRAGLKPLDIVQPEGPSFTVDGNLVQWQKWSFRVGFEPYEGLVLHTVTYDDAGRVRPVLHRASISEMVVPYGDPGQMHGWKNAFDAGEWGLGRLANPLVLGCDCLGAIHYFDAVLATEEGDPYTVERVICMHEEDYGILWKHRDLHGGTDETRRSRRLVVSFIATVGNYEYGFYWYFYQDGNIQLEVKLTGIISSMAVVPGDIPGFAGLVAPGLAGPNHQHLFCARLDLDVDGTTNRVHEVEAEPLPPGPSNPYANAFRQRVTPLPTELAARRLTSGATSRHWRIESTEATNWVGQPTAYRLLPTASTPTLFAQPESNVAQRAGFARYNLWVTPYERDERRAAGEYVNQHAGGDGLPAWTADDRGVEDTDVVLWYSFGVTHFVRPEDFPVMPVEYTGFLLSPGGFFDRNPALDVAPSSNGHCD